MTIDFDNLLRSRYNNPGKVILVDLSAKTSDQIAANPSRSKVAGRSSAFTLSSAGVLRWRWLALGLVIALVAFHQFFLSAILSPLAPTWRFPVEVAVYSVTGILAAWLALTQLGLALARREQAENELREAFAKLEFNHQKLLALHDLGRRVADANSEESILELAAQGALQLTGARASSVVTFDADRDRLTLDMTWGLSYRYLRAMRARMEEGIPAERCHNCMVLKTEATTDCPLFAGLYDEARAEGICSLICLPIMREQERVGIVAAYFPTVDGPPEDHIRLLHILGEVIATALDNMRRRVRQVDTLHALDRATQNNQTLNDLAARMLEIAATAWEAQVGMLFLYDHVTQTWSQVACYPRASESSHSYAQRGLDLAEQARLAGKPVTRSTSPNENDLSSLVAVPFTTEDKSSGAIFLCSNHLRTFTEEHTELLMTVANQIALAIRNAQLYARVGEIAALEERYRLSREIHDGLAQTLSYLSFQAEHLEGLIAAGRYETSATEIAEMRQSISAAYVDVREAIDGLRLNIEDSSKLTVYLANLVEEFRHQTGIAAHVFAQPQDFSIDSETSIQLIRITQEALANIRKHAQAHLVQVTLQQLPNAVELSVSDDGRGFPEAQPGHVYHSHGMATMRERARGLGGTFTLVTGPGQGTRIMVTVPIELETKSVV